MKKILFATMILLLSCQLVSAQSIRKLKMDQLQKMIDTSSVPLVVNFWATALTLVTTLLFSYWVNNFASYNKIYGSIGTVLIIMVLVYINSLILLIGFELNVSITYLTKAAEERKKAEQDKKKQAAP